MDDFRNVMFERMRPSQIVARRRQADVAFLPLGNLEWHGVFNPFGLDGLKAHNVCCRAAALMNGGVVFPSLIWGVPRDSFNVGITDDLAKDIANILDTEPLRWQGFSRHGGMDIQAQWLFYQQLLRMSLEHIAGFGFRSIYICSGHGPFVHWIRPVAAAFTRASKCAGSMVTTDWANAYEPAGLKGDHAGKGETSAMMAIDPTLVDLGELGRTPRGAVGCGTDALQANAEHGEQWLAACAAGVAKEAKWLSDHYPALPERHAHSR